MGSLSEGEHWLWMRDWPIKQLSHVANQQGFHRGEEMARTLLRNRLRDRRVGESLRASKAGGPVSVFHDLASCTCTACKRLRVRAKR